MNTAAVGTSPNRLALRARVRILVLGFVLAIAGCDSTDETPVEAVDFEVRMVLMSALTQEGWSMTEPEELASLGIEPTPDVMTAIAWLSVGDCAAVMPPLSEVRTACDENGTYLFLLAGDPLTQDDMNSARLSSNLFNPDEPNLETLHLTFTEDGAERLKYMSHAASLSRSSDGLLAFILDGVVVAATAMREANTSGELSAVSFDGTLDWEPVVRALNAASA